LDFFYHGGTEIMEKHGELGFGIQGFGFGFLILAFGFWAFFTTEALRAWRNTES